MSDISPSESYSEEETFVTVDDNTPLLCESFRSGE